MIVKLNNKEKEALANDKCPRCSNKIRVYYDRIQLLCYICKDCNFEYPYYPQRDLKRWEYGAGWWNVYEHNGKKRKKIEKKEKNSKEEN